MPARDDDAPDNSDEISRVRRKKMIALSVFFGSIAFMPLSCFTCCGAAAFISNDTAKGVFGIAGFLSPFIGLVALILMWSDRGRYTRALELAQQADEWGLAYVEVPKGKALRLIRTFQAFRGPTNEYPRNGLAGSYKRRPVVIMDYSCAWGIGRYADVMSQTAIILKDAVANVPDLIVFPKSMLAKLNDVLGLEGSAVKVPNASKFNKAFGLYANQAIKAVACMTPELMARCLEEGDLVLEVHDGDLLVYWRETYIKPEDLKDRLATAIEIASLLRRAELRKEPG